MNALQWTWLTGCRALVAALTVLFLCLAAAGPCCGSDRLLTRPISISPGGTPTPEQDDAALHAVCLLRSGTGFAVGDRGAAWKTVDGGTTWEFVSIPTMESLSGVSFVDERHGWVVGRGTRASTGSPVGVAFRTVDGGETWERCSNQILPRLAAVRFFDATTGVAIGDANEEFPTGVLTTSDGGATWNAMAGPAGSWRTGAFLDGEIGFVGGEAGRRNSISAGQLNVEGTVSSLRGFRGAAIDEMASLSWLVGDGGQVMRSEANGASWEAVGESLPREVGLLFDFQAVAAHAGHVWIAGAPGSVVWHSPDGGQNWRAHPTGETTPIRAIATLGSQQLVAVGDLGKILASADGGETWQPVRGGGRRLSVLALHAHAGRTSFMQIVRDAGERGYRTGAWALVRRDVGRTNVERDDLESRFHDSAVAAGASWASIDWRLPISIPGLDRNGELLQREWGVLTDQKLDDVLSAVVAKHLLTWRPEIVLLDDAPADDVPTKLLHQALVRAVEESEQGGRTRYRQLWRTAQLPAWRPQRGFSRLPGGSDGAIRIDGFEWLAASGGTISTLVARVNSELFEPTKRGSFEAFHEVPLGTNPAPRKLRDFYDGLELLAGGDARREARPIEEQGLEAGLDAAQRQRNFASITAKMLDGPGANQLVAQLSELTAGVSDQQAALQLASLANEYRSRANWESAEATLLELALKYPAEPVAQEAMRWLLTFWASEEMEWQRMRGLSASRTMVQRADAVGAGDVQQAGGTVQVGDLQSVLSAAGRAIDEDVAQGQSMGRRRLDSAKRAAQAAQIKELLDRLAPSETSDPQMKLTWAALLNRQRRFQEADTIFTGFSQVSGSTWFKVGQGEVWLRRPQVQPIQSVYLARQTERPPLLDGVLSDTCWEQCDELRLVSESDNTPQPLSQDGGRVRIVRAGRSGAEAVCMLCYDAKYLYVAGNAPRSSGLAVDPPSYAGRPYDGDLEPFDRISLALDVNRDYASFYRFDVDQRGWTRDACWVSQEWNPKWHVAANADERYWRVEIAIPWEELVPAPPQRGTAWAMGAMRTMPGVGRQAWQWPASDEFRTDAFGLLRFE